MQTIARDMVNEVARAAFHLLPPRGGLMATSLQRRVMVQEVHGTVAADGTVTPRADTTPTWRKGH